jgi:hypothetical protein
MSFPPPPGPPADPYPQEPHPQQPYPQQPYPFPAPYEQQAPYQPQAPYGYQPYAYPGGYPSPAPSRMSAPIVGWLMLGAAILAIVGSIGTWATVHLFGQSIDVGGSEAGVGNLTAFFAAVIAITALFIALRQGRLWASIVGLVFATFTLLIGLINLGSLSRLYGPARDLPDNTFSVGYGLWLVIIGAAAALALSIVAMVQRTASGPAH